MSVDRHRKMLVGSSGVGIAGLVQGLESALAPPVPEGTINTTDPDCNLVKGQHGWLQGYNAQAAVNEHQIVIAAEIEVVSPDFGHLERIVTAARGELVTQPPGAIVADSGYWHIEQMHRLAADGIPVLIPPDSGLHTKPRPGWDGGYYAFMRRALATELGAALYKQRQHLIETVFGSISTTAAAIASTDEAESPSAPSGA
jgi:hypothetical protein